MKEIEYTSQPVDLKRKFLIKLYRNELKFELYTKRTKCQKCLLKIQSKPRMTVFIDNDELSRLKNKANDVQQKMYHEEYKEMRQEADILHDKVSEKYDENMKDYVKKKLENAMSSKKNSPSRNSFQQSSEKKRYEDKSLSSRREVRNFNEATPERESSQKMATSHRVEIYDHLRSPKVISNSKNLDLIMHDEIRARPNCKESIRQIKKNIFQKDNLEDPNDFIDVTHELYVAGETQNKDYFYANTFDKIRHLDKSPEAQAFMISQNEVDMMGYNKERENFFENFNSFDNLTEIEEVKQNEESKITEKSESVDDTELYQVQEQNMNYKEKRETRLKTFNETENVKQDKRKEELESKKKDREQDREAKKKELEEQRKADREADRDKRRQEKEADREKLRQEKEADREKIRQEKDRQKQEKLRQREEAEEVDRKKKEMERIKLQEKREKDLKEKLRMQEQEAIEQEVLAKIKREHKEKIEGLKNERLFEIEKSRIAKEQKELEREQYLKDEENRQKIEIIKAEQAEIERVAQLQGAELEVEERKKAMAILKIVKVSKFDQKSQKEKLEDTEFKDRMSEIQNDSDVKVKKAASLLKSAGFKDGTQVYDYIKDMYKNVATFSNNLSKNDQTTSKEDAAKFPDAELTGNTETAQKNKSKISSSNKTGFQETPKRAKTPLNNEIFMQHGIVDKIVELGLNLDKNDDNVSYIERSIRKYNKNSETLFSTEKFNAERQKHIEAEKQKSKEENDVYYQIVETEEFERKIKKDPNSTYYQPYLSDIARGKSAKKINRIHNRLERGVTPELIDDMESEIITEKPCLNFGYIKGQNLTPNKLRKSQNENLQTSADKNLRSSSKFDKNQKSSHKPKKVVRNKNSYTKGFDKENQFSGVEHEKMLLMDRYDYIVDGYVDDPKDLLPDRFNLEIKPKWNDHIKDLRSYKKGDQFLGEVNSSTNLSSEELMSYYKNLVQKKKMDSYYRKGEKIFHHIASTRKSYTESRIASQITSKQNSGKKDSEIFLESDRTVASFAVNLDEALAKEIQEEVATEQNQDIPVLDEVQEESILSLYQEKSFDVDISKQNITLDNQEEYSYDENQENETEREEIIETNRENEQDSVGENPELELNENGFTVEENSPPGYRGR